MHLDRGGGAANVAKVFANQLKLWTSLPLPERKFILVRNKSLHLLNAPFVLETRSLELPVLGSLAHSFPASVSIHVHVQKFCAYIRASNLHHSLKTNTPHKGFGELHRKANKQANIKCKYKCKGGKTNWDRLSEPDIGHLSGNKCVLGMGHLSLGALATKAIYIWVIKANFKASTWRKRNLGSAYILI